MVRPFSPLSSRQYAFGFGVTIFVSMARAAEARAHFRDGLPWFAAAP